MPVTERVVFKGSMEALYLRGLKGRLDASLQLQLKAAGLDLAKPLQPAYAEADYKKQLALAVHGLYGASPSATQLRELGQVWTDGFFETLMGIALLGVLKVIGPRRSLLRSRQNYRNINNYSDAEARELASGHFEVSMDDGEDWPEIAAGSLQRSVELCGGKGAVVTVARTEGSRHVYEVRWRP